MNRNEKRAIAPKLLSLFAVLLLLPMVVQASEEEDRPNTSQYATTEWTVDTANVRKLIGQGLPVEFPGPDGSMFLVLLEEFNAIAGPKVKYVVDENDQVIGTEPLEYWSFWGSVVDVQSSNVLITMDDRGLYGHIAVNGARTTFKPADEDHVLAPGEDAKIIVRWKDQGGIHATLEEAVEATPLDDPTEPWTVPAASGTGGTVNTQTNVQGGGSTPSTNCPGTAIVRPYADYKFRYWHSNWDTRIRNAMNAQVSMWQKDTCITFTYQTPFPAPNWIEDNFPTCSESLQAFTNYHARYSEVDAYQGFTGKNLQGCYGYATTSDYGSGYMSVKKDSIVESVDWGCCDTYDPDETTTDLGLVSGQEIAHNWGQKEHLYTTRSLDGTYNIMASNTDHDKREFWFPPTAIKNIKKATTGKLS